jgi:hypothetical protein
MPYRIMFFPRAPGKPVSETKVGAVDTLEDARRYAFSNAERDVEYIHIEIAGYGIVERWVWSDGWQRNDNAKRP